jgi:hypothetical protein
MTWQPLCQGGILPIDCSFFRRLIRGAQKPAWRIKFGLPMELSKGSILKSGHARYNSLPENLALAGGVIFVLVRP